MNDFKISMFFLDETKIDEAIEKQKQLNLHEYVSPGKNIKDDILYFFFANQLGNLKGIINAQLKLLKTSNNTNEMAKFEKTLELYLYLIESFLYLLDKVNCFYQTLIVSALCQICKDNTLDNFLTYLEEHKTYFTSDVELIAKKIIQHINITSLNNKASFPSNVQSNNESLFNKMKNINANSLLGLVNTFSNESSRVDIAVWEFLSPSLDDLIESAYARYDHEQCCQENY